MDILQNSNNVRKVLENYKEAFKFRLSHMPLIWTAAFMKQNQNLDYFIAIVSFFLNFSQPGIDHISIYFGFLLTAWCVSITWYFRCYFFRYIMCMIGFHFISTLGGRVSAGNTQHTWCADFLQSSVQVSICLIPFIGYIRWGEKREDAECLLREREFGCVCVCGWVFFGADLRVLSLALSLVPYWGRGRGRTATGAALSPSLCFFAGYQSVLC
jgi:hypothetical protein